ncbi:MAG: hypothetical protein ABIT01_18380 [Thermoanaerobaculia bacterium]
MRTERFDPLAGRDDFDRRTARPSQNRGRVRAALLSGDAELTQQPHGIAAHLLPTAPDEIVPPDELSTKLMKSSEEHALGQGQREEAKTGLWEQLNTLPLGGAALTKRHRSRDWSVARFRAQAIGAVNRNRARFDSLLSMSRSDSTLLY